MKLAHLPDRADVPAVCHFCGEAIPVVAWFGFDRLSEAGLALCRECAESVAGGLLLDLADSDAELEALVDRLRARLHAHRAAVEAVALVRASTAQEGHGDA